MYAMKYRIIPLIICLISAVISLTACKDFDFLFKKPDPLEIQYAEFPFKITYKLDGEVYTVEGIYVCEYDGLSWNEGTGYEYEWRGYIKGTGDELLYITEKDGIKLQCIVGGPLYYMGMWNYSGEYTPQLNCQYYMPDIGFTISTCEDEYLEKFDIELIDWELSEPLVKNDD